MIPLVDAHAHLGSEEERLARKNILTVLCGTDPESARTVLSMVDAHTLASCALHPWNVEKVTLEEMRPLIEQAPILGEIGLDNVWTGADLGAQRRAFRAQLELAQALQKPVVLHTKGMEAEIARTLRPYSIRKLVHWYSCMDYLDDYLEQDCYFTVGPDYAVNPAVRQVLSRVPLSRLLTETDGMSSVSWALGYAVDPSRIEDVLQGEADAIAHAKGVTGERARAAVYENLMRFIYGQ